MGKVGNIITGAMDLGLGDIVDHSIVAWFCQGVAGELKLHRGHHESRRMHGIPSMKP